MASEQHPETSPKPEATKRKGAKRGSKPGKKRKLHSEEGAEAFNMNVEIELHQRILRDSGMRGPSLEIIARSLDEDVETRYRSSMRHIRFLCRADVVRNPDGAPLKDQRGNTVQLTMIEQVMHAVARAAMNSQHPQQAEMAELFLNYAGGIPVKNLQLTGPKGGPLEAHTTAAVAPALMSDEEIAARTMAALKLAQDISQRSQAPRAITGIEVKGAPAPAGGGLVIDVQASSSPPTTAADPTPAPVGSGRPNGTPGNLPGNLVAPSVGKK